MTADTTDTTSGAPDAGGETAAPTRRQFVRAAGNAGLAVGLARLSPIDDVLASGNRRTITYGYARSEPDDPATMGPLTATVPENWYETVTRAFDLHRTLVEAEPPGVLGSAVVPGSFDSPMASIAVDVLPDAEAVVRERLTDLVDSIEYAVTVVQDPSDPHGDVDVDEMDFAATFDGPGVPGGIICGDGDGMGTLGPAMVDPETGERFFVTSNHLYGGDGEDRRGDPLYVLRGRDDQVEIARHVRGYAHQDFVRADPLAGFEPQHRIRGLDPGRVDGQFTRIGLAYLKARGDPLQKMGARTDYTSGQIQGIDGMTCYTRNECRRGQLRWGDQDQFSDGDSGAVAVAPDPRRPDRLLAASCSTARTWWPGQSYIWGTAAYRITDVHGYFF